MRANDGSHNGQSEATAAGFAGAGGIGAVEAFKDLVGLSLRNAGPVIPYLDDRKRAFRTGPNTNCEFYRGALWRVAQGVAHQVADYLPKFGLIPWTGAGVGTIRRAR